MNFRKYITEAVQSKFKLHDIVKSKCFKSNDGSKSVEGSIASERLWDERQNVWYYKIKIQYVPVDVYQESQMFRVGKIYTEMETDIEPIQRISNT